MYTVKQQIIIIIKNVQPVTQSVIDATAKDTMPHSALQNMAELVIHAETDYLRSRF